MKDVIGQIGRNVRKYRVLRGYDVTELADLANLSKTQIYKIEEGRNNNFKADTLIKIAIALDITMDRLIPLMDHASGKQIMAEKLDDMTSDCDILTRHMILGTVKSLVELSKLLNKNHVFKYRTGNSKRKSLE